MESNRIFKLAAVILVVGLVGCDTADDRMVETEHEIFTEPTLETVEVERMTEDTFLIERTTEVEVNVDTTRIEGDAVPTTNY